MLAKLPKGVQEHKTRNPKGIPHLVWVRAVEMLLHPCTPGKSRIVIWLFEELLVSIRDHGHCDCRSCNGKQGIARRTRRGHRGGRRNKIAWLWRNTRARSAPSWSHVTV
jgi:hypothetical protein